MSVSDEAVLLNFMTELMLAENGIKSGFRNGLWFPHRSLEGGTDTIAYGHKLTKQEQDSGVFNKGLTELEAKDLFIKDLKKHSDVAGNQWNRFQTPKFEELPIKYRCVLIDLVYNAGSLINSKGAWGWPNLAKNIIQGNDQGVFEHSQRSYIDKDTGARVKLVKRSEKICKAVGLVFLNN